MSDSVSKKEVLEIIAIFSNRIIFNLPKNHQRSLEEMTSKIKQLSTVDDKQEVKEIERVKSYDMTFKHIKDKLNEIIDTINKMR
jgi:hypothetical protein